MPMPYSTKRIPARLVAGTDLIGCACEYDASKLALNNLDRVPSFTDQSLSLAHATAAGVARPTFKTNQLNGLSVVEYDGAANASAITGTLLNITKDFTAFVVFKSTAIPSANHGLFGNNAHCTITHHTDANFYGYVGTPGANNVFAPRGAGVWSIATFAWDGTMTDPYSMVMRSEGVLKKSRQSTLAPSSTADYAIGQIPGFGAFFNGQIAHVIAYRRRLFDVEMMKVEEMLFTKWGL